MSFTINSKSQSYRFLAKYNSKFKRLKEISNGTHPYAELDWYVKDTWDAIPRTFCDYYRLVFSELCSFALLAVIITFGAIMALFPLLLLVPHLRVVDNDLWQGAMVFAGFDTAILVLLGIALAKGAYEDYRMKHPKLADLPKEPGVLVTAYRSWKDKFCPIINYDIETKKPETIEE